MTTFIVIVLAIGLLSAFAHFANKHHEKTQLRRAEQIVGQHAQELTVKRKQLTITGSYGLIDTTKWEREIAFFIENVVRPAVGAFRGENFARICQCIQLTTAQYQALTPRLRPEMSGVEYEQLVADLLRSRGWETRLTKGSGDQGVDVIALKGGVKAVIQCKLYSQPVGNSAVQEAMGGCAYENGNIAAVVTNAGFTSAARQLAASTGVLLLHHDELSRLDLFLPKGGDITVARSAPIEADGTLAAPMGDPAQGEAAQRSAPSGAKVIGYSVAALAIAGIVVGLMHSSPPKADTTAASVQMPEPTEAVSPAHTAAAVKPVGLPAQHLPVEVPPAQVTDATTTNPVDPAAIPSEADAGPGAESPTPPAPSSESAPAPGPTSEQAYQRCMQYLASQGPEAKPGDYSAVCSKEQQ